MSDEEGLASQRGVPATPIPEGLLKQKLMSSLFPNTRNLWWPWPLVCCSHAQHPDLHGPGVPVRGRRGLHRAVRALRRLPGLLGRERRARLQRWVWPPRTPGSPSALLGGPWGRTLSSSSSVWKWKGSCSLLELQVRRGPVPPLMQRQLTSPLSGKCWS